MKNNLWVTVDDQKFELSHLDKVLYPKTGFTKGQMLEYYTHIAPVMVPYLEGRPVTLKRYPEGVEGPFFYEKECPRYHPKWLPIATVDRNTKKGGVIHYCTIDNQAALLWVANLASIEIHVLLSKKENIECPTAMVFDLDPGEGMTILDCAWAALELKKYFDALKLHSFAKTSGKKGIHLYVPMNNPRITFKETKVFAHATAMLLEQQYPDRVVSNMSKALRVHKIFVDWSQNDEHKTTCAAYSLRVAPEPTVSTPVTWDEIAGALNKKDPNRLVFPYDHALKRIEKMGDLFKAVLTLKQNMPDMESSNAPISRKASSSARLEMYRQKRHFSVTPEPEGGRPAKGKPHFVIQKHAASHLHYDFRLENEGVLVSWAVPKGPSIDPNVKRLAMHVEDHPLDYAGFEGIIPQGEYGGGTVMVWDQGTFVNMTHQRGKPISLSEGLAHGHIDFWLQGKKLQGGWSLTRMGQDDKHWLLIKRKDEMARAAEEPVEALANSAVTGRSMDAIADDQKSHVWHSNRAG